MPHRVLLHRVNHFKLPKIAITSQIGKIVAKNIRDWIDLAQEFKTKAN